MKNQILIPIACPVPAIALRACLLSLVIIFSGKVTKAQDITKANLVWTSSKSLDMTDSTIYNESCKFTTLGNTSMEWNQKEGARIYTYTITSSEGQWSDVSTGGQMKYNVALGDKVTGSILFSREQNQLRGLLTIYGNGQLRFSYTFYFDSVQTAQ